MKSLERMFDAGLVSLAFVKFLKAAAFSFFAGAGFWLSGFILNALAMLAGYWDRPPLEWLVTELVTAFFVVVTTGLIFQSGLWSDDGSEEGLGLRPLLFAPNVTAQAARRIGFVLNILWHFMAAWLVFEVTYAMAKAPTPELFGQLMLVVWGLLIAILAWLGGRTYTRKDDSFRTSDIAAYFCGAMLLAAVLWVAAAPFSPVMPERLREWLALTPAGYSNLLALIFLSGRLGSWVWNLPAARPVMPRQEVPQVRQPAPVVRQRKPTAVATYTLGDDSFDLSFEVGTRRGDFLGECGAGTNEVARYGEGPVKVAGIDVWFFDKVAVATSTAVLLSEAAYNDPRIRTQVSRSGNVVLQAAPGLAQEYNGSGFTATFVVEQLVYANVAGFPPNSIFQVLQVAYYLELKQGVET